MADRTTTNLIGNITITRDTSYGGDFCCLNDRTDRESYVVVGKITDVAALGRALVAFAGGLTVGAALSLPEVQRGEAVAESSDHGRVQIGIVNQCVRVRCMLGGAWTGWEMLDAYKPSLLALPARVVPLASADADPSTRGDL